MSTLNDLDAIPWEWLTHAYGSASDVPAQIRAIVSGDPGLRKAAFTELFSNIWHQGTVYEATIHALPILIDLLRTNAVPEPDRDYLALLIANILSGRGYWEVHGSLTQLTPNLSELEERITRERLIVAEVRSRGVAALELLIPYLQHPEAELRGTVAESFEHYPEQAETLVPALRTALDIEQDEEARSRMTTSFHILTHAAGSAH